VIDSHCHLADEAFAPDLDAVVERAKAAGLERAFVILDPGSPAEASQAARLQTLWPEVRVAIGVHPHHAHQYTDEPERAARTVRERFAATPSARAIGEIGLDYHYDFSSPEVQRAVFRAQLRLARELKRPVVVHAREADEDMLSILRREPAGEVSGVFHCFSGTADLAAAALELGFHLSFSGIVTFPRADDLRTIARGVPLDRLLIETDSPFLSPVPHRGQRNEPARVVHVASQLAGIFGLTTAELATRTTANFHALFAP
jgi:TatD DNase family protein